MQQPGTLLHALPLPVALFDDGLGYLSGNDAWRTMLEAEALPPPQPGTSFFELFPETAATLLPLIRRAQAGETVTAAGLRLIIGDSTHFWDIAVMPAPGAQAPGGFVCAVTDVTERMLSNQLLSRRVADRTRRLTALYAILDAAANSDDLGHVCATALHHGLEATHADAGAILFSADDEGRQRLLAASGLSPALAEQLRRRPPAEALAELPRRTAMAPILVRERPQGHILLLRSAKRPFNDDDQLLLVSIADQLGVVIERALLQLESERVIVLQERNRLSRELHDAVTQSLYSLTLFAEASQRMVQAGDTAAAEQYMGRVSATARQALREMRLLVHNLRPSALENAGLEQALRQRIDAVERRAGISARVEVTGSLQLPAHVEEALYQIAQEALNNSLKHANAGSVDVRLRQERNRLMLAVEDNGQGFDPARSDGGGLGIASMRERAALLGGTLQINRLPHGGTEVRVDLDLGQVAKPAGSNGLQTLLDRNTP